MRISQRNLPSFLAKLITYLSPLVVMLAFALVAILVSVESALTALFTIGIPIIVAVAIVIWKSRILKGIPSATFSGFHLSSRSLLYLVALFIISYLLSLCFLIHGGPRPTVYFCLVAMMAGLIFIEILGIKQEHSSWLGVILTQIVLLSLNIIFGQTLNLPLYFGGGDILYHMGYVSTLAENGHVSSAIGAYQYFPLFHIFGASGVLVAGMQLRTSYFVLNGFAFVISLPIVYLLVNQLTNDRRISLLATLLYCLSREVIFNSMYMNTREMAYLFCLLILYLQIQRKRWLRIISVGLIIPLVFLHQTTLLHFSVILVGIMIIDFVLSRRSRYISLDYVVLFTIAYVGYWFWQCYPFLSDWLITASTSETVSIPEAGGVRESLITIMANSRDYIILIFFVFIGIISQLKQDNQDVTITQVFALFTFVLIPFFIPSTTVVLSPLFLTYRLPLLLSPFIALAMAAGVLALIPRWDKNRQRLKLVKSMVPLGLILLLILFYSFSSVLLLGRQTDLIQSGSGSTEPRRYFTQAELTSLSFLDKYSGDVPIYTDSHAARCLFGYLRIPANGIPDALDPEAIGEGYMLFRKEVFKLTGVLFFDPTSRTSIYYGLFAYRKGDTPDLETMWQGEDTIFSNSAVQIYLK